MTSLQNTGLTSNVPNSHFFSWHRILHSNSVYSLIVGEFRINFILNVTSVLFCFVKLPLCSLATPHSEEKSSPSLFAYGGYYLFSLADKEGPEKPAPKAFGASSGSNETSSLVLLESLQFRIRHE